MPNKDCDRAIAQLLTDFQTSPKKYFAEAELQYELYCILKSSKLINKSAVTTDGVKLFSVHPEYPSVDRIQLKSGKGYRVWFDLAVLNTDFMSANEYKTVWARNEHEVKDGDNVLAAFEFKYFPLKRTHDLSSVEVDCLKLSMCKEVKDRYVLAFSTYEIDEFVVQSIDVGAATLFWATPQTVHYKST